MSQAGPVPEQAAQHTLLAHSEGAGHSCEGLGASQEVLEVPIDPQPAFVFFQRGCRCQRMPRLASDLSGVRCSTLLSRCTDCASHMADDLV